MALVMFTLNSTENFEFVPENAVLMVVNPNRKAKSRLSFRMNLYGSDMG